MIHLLETEAFSDLSEMLIRRRGTNIVGRRMTLLPGDTADSFEEVDALSVNSEMSASIEAEIRQTAYHARVDALIRLRYTIADELALLRQRDTKPDEFASYHAYAEQCKAKARAEIYST